MESPPLHSEQIIGKLNAHKTERVNQLFTAQGDDDLFTYGVPQNYNINNKN